MSWRIALIDSCGCHPKARASAAFVSEGGCVRRREADLDHTGHGTRIAEILTRSGGFMDLVLAQVFIGGLPASAATVAAAVEWATMQGANLLHLSLGLTADRVVLREAVSRALDSGVLVVAASPARGQKVFPAAYPGLIAATGDARCAPGELSRLGPRLFGGCPHGAAERLDDRPSSGGASIGATWVSRAILDLPPGIDTAGCLELLDSKAIYRGPEHRAYATAPRCSETLTELK